MNSSIFNFNFALRTIRRGRRPTGLLMAAALIVLVEVLLALHPRPEYKDLVRHRLYSPAVAPDIAESIVQWQVAHATLVNEQQDLLLLGDSACLNGLLAVELMERTGLKTWNLGTFGFTYTTGHADILELFIERNGPPRFLIYYTSYYPLARDRGTRAVRSWLGRLQQWLAPAERTSHLLPSLRYRRELRDSIWALGREEIGYAGLDVPRGKFGSDNEVRRELWENRGSFPRGAEEVFPEDRFEDGISWNPRFHPDCEGGLRRIAKTAREYSFPVIILFSPLPEAANSKAVRRQVADLEANLERVFARYPGVSLYQPFLRFYPDDHCIDMRHLTFAGTKRQTEEIARWIRDHWLGEGGGEGEAS
ncbi:MAG: hypothetical protein P9M08_06055 [Candidatus Erginobacter occultus]|nr:hypothetical protein [Candidatus Erginobacter occultus]